MEFLNLSQNGNTLLLLDKQGKIDDVLSPNQTILTQIIKEPISTKGPRISSRMQPSSELR